MARRLSRCYHVVLFAALTMLAGIMITALFPLVDRTASLVGPVDHYLDQSGVEHPLTAVLLNFRGYDTLLEIGVLLCAVIAVWSLGSAPRPVRNSHPAYHDNPVLRIAIGILMPLTVMAAGYMVWVGAYRPGGAFQAGTVLGAAWVMLVVSGVIPIPLVRTRKLRLLLAAGFLVFMSVAVLTGGMNGTLLTYPVSLSGGLILFIETVLSVSIGSTIGVLFAAVSGSFDQDIHQREDGGVS